MAGNLDQADYWNGEVGQRWARSQRALDAVFAPLTEVLFASADLGPAASVLDIGCGAGETALIAANRIGPRGHVVAADLSAPLLAVAQDRATREAGTSAPIEWIEADAERHDFGQARFERVISRFGVMFFEDSVAAFANLRRALAPGGRLVFLCWRSSDDNPWVSLPRGIALRLAPDFEPPPPGAPGPFRFAERATVERVLARAGFAQIAVDPIERPLVLGTAADGSARAAAEAAARFVVELGPVSRVLREREPTVRDAACAAIARAFEPLAAAGAVALDGACWLVRATR